jgi:hypothetical protein
MKSQRWLMLLTLVIPSQSYEQESQPQTGAIPKSRAQIRAEMEAADRLYVTAKQNDERNGAINDYNAAVSTSDPIRLRRGVLHDPKPETGPLTYDLLEENELNDATGPLGESSDVDLGTASTLPLEYSDATPTDTSDAIIIGTVSSSSSYLNNSKRGIYSEFKVEIQQILKGQRISIGQSIDTVRVGGRLRLPSGKILVRNRTGYSYPLHGRQYLFFLKEFDTHDSEYFKIVTGYELSAGKVVASIDTDDTGNQFGQYKGMDEVQFISVVKKEMLQHSPVPDNCLPGRMCL